MALVPLVVTTKLKGVFFGHGEKPNGGALEQIKLERARMCVSWSSDMRGVTGLAACGPSKSCKIGLSVPSILLTDVSSVMECSTEAAAKWESQPWG